jgi:copper chaperone CopZ
MKTTITIKGTHCNACKALIEDVAHDVQGIQSCTVDLATGKTEVEYESDIALENFTKEINSLGNYEVISLKL